MSVRSVYTQKSDCTGLTTGHVVFSTSTTPVSKEVLFHAVNRICNASRTNPVIKQMLDNF